MPAQSSPHSSQESLPPTAAELRDAVQEDEEATQVMGREDLPDFEKAHQNCAAAHQAPESESPITERDYQGTEPERRPPQRPSTFTRLLIDPRR